MTPIKSLSSLLSSCSSQGNNQNNTMKSDIVMEGCLTKRKNMKKNFYVLRSEPLASLDCYETENKFKNGCQPKKTYILKNCIHIKCQIDEPHFVITLYINKECMGLVAENKEDMEKWSQKLQELINSDLKHPGDGLKIRNIEFKHLWPVDVLPWKFEKKANITGSYWLCLTDWLLSLVKVEDISIKKEFQLSTIRRCGIVCNFFFFELGNRSDIGYGKLHMKAKNSRIAQKIHAEVARYMNKYTESSFVNERNERNVTNSVDIDSLRYLLDMSTSEEEYYPSRYLDMTVSSKNQDDLYERYVHMGPGVGGDSLKESHWERLEIIRNMDLNHESCPTQNSEKYVPMGPGVDGSPPNESHPRPDTLEVSPRDIKEPHSISNSPLEVDTSTSLSPSIDQDSYWSFCSPGSQKLSDHSSPQNNSLLSDSFEPILSPRTKGFLLSETSNHYLEMGPKPSIFFGSDGRQRTVSNPTPLILSPSEEEGHCGRIGNNFSSSWNSATLSDHIPLEPLLGSDHNLIHNCICEEDDFDPLVAFPRPMRTSSVGSKPVRCKWKKSAHFSGGSPISHSWSGSSGTHFHSLVRHRNSHKESRLMELDFSKKKSPVSFSESKGKQLDQKTSKERLRCSFSRHQHRSYKTTSCSNFKCSGVVSSTLGNKEKQGSKIEVSSKQLEIPNIKENPRFECNELDFTWDNLRRNSNSLKGYLPMHSPPLISPLTPTGEIMVEEKGQRIFNKTRSNVSPSLNMCVSKDDYVDMTRGGCSGPLTITSSSPPKSISITPGGGMCLKTSNSPVSQELPALDDYTINKQHEMGMTESTKKTTKGRKKSLRENNKRKKSEGSNACGESLPEGSNSNKLHGPFATFSNRIFRKPSWRISHRPKGSEESIKRKNALHGCEGDTNTVSLSSDNCSLPLTCFPEASTKTFHVRDTPDGFNAKLSPSIPRDADIVEQDPQEGENVSLHQTIREKERDEDVKQISTSANPKVSVNGHLPNKNFPRNSVRTKLCYIETIKNCITSNPHLPLTDGPSSIPSFKETPSQQL